MSECLASRFDENFIEDCHFCFAQCRISHEVGPRSSASASGPIDELNFGPSQA